MTKLTSYYSGESFEVNIVSDEDLPRGCDWITALTSDKDMERYEIYKDCVTKMYYAVVEETIPF